jgi:hypothetical protein
VESLRLQEVRVFYIYLEYNISKSAQHPERVKIYAGLTQIEVLEVEDKKPLR